MTIKKKLCQTSIFASMGECRIRIAEGISIYITQTDLGPCVDIDKWDEEKVEWRCHKAVVLYGDIL